MLERVNVQLPNSMSKMQMFDIKRVEDYLQNKIEKVKVDTIENDIGGFYEPGT